LEGQLDESRAKVSSLEAECGEKRDETDKLRQEMDALSQTHRVSSTFRVTYYVSALKIQSRLQVAVVSSLFIQCLDTGWVA